MPTIRGWLRERVGPQADVAQVTSEGGLVHLDGVRLPIGPRGVVALERATVQLSPFRGDGGGIGLADARLHAFEGVLRFGSEDEPSFVARLSFRAVADPDASAWIAGELSIGGATWTHDAASAPMHGAARMFVTSTTWRLEGGTLERDGALVRFEGRGALDAESPETAVTEATLVVEAARVGPFVDAMAAIVGRSIDLPAVVPLDAKLEGRIDWGERGGEADVRVVADALDVTARGTLAPDLRTLAGRVGVTLAIAKALRRADVPAKALPREDDRLELDLQLSGSVARPVVRGAVSSPTIGFRMGRPRFMPHVTFEPVAGTVTYEGGRVLVTVGAHVGTGGVVLGIEGDPRDRASFRATLRVSQVDMAWIRQAATSLGVELALPSEGWRLDADLETSDLRTVRGTAKLGARTHEAEAVERTSLEAVVRASRDGARWRVGGSRIEGTLAIRDVVAMGLLDGSVQLSPEGTLHVDMGLDGWADAVNVSGAVVSPSFCFAVPAADLPPLAFSDVTGVFAYDHHARRFAWRHVRGRAYGGLVTTSGFVVSAGDARFAVSIARASAGDLPLGDGGAPLGTIVRGDLSVDLRWDRRAGAAPVGWGFARLERASLPVLETLRPELARFGLAPPPAEATSPLTTALDVVSGGVRLRTLRIDLDGASVRGDVRVGLEDDAALDGDLEVVLEDEYLASSLAFVVPSVLAERVAVPVRLRGTLRAPAIDAKLAATLGRFLVDNRIGTFAKEAASEVASLFGKPPERALPRSRAEHDGRIEVREDDFAHDLAAHADWKKLEERLASLDVRVEGPESAGGRYRVG